MSYFTLECGEIMMDAVGVFFIGATILYLTILKYKGYRASFKKASDISSRFFNEEILLQLIKRQFNSSFENILHTLDQEKKGLLQYFAQVSEGNNLNSAHTGDVKQLIDRGSNRDVRDDYDDVIKFAGFGLNANEISQKSGIPMAEVELVLKLNNGN